MSYRFKYQGYGSLEDLDGERVEIIRELTDADREAAEKKHDFLYDDLVLWIRLPNGERIPARRDEVVEEEVAAPSIDQIETANRLLRKMHPFLTGLTVLGHSATFSVETSAYTLRIDVLVDAEEIWASHRSYCYRIAGDGSYVASSTADLPALV